MFEKKFCAHRGLSALMPENTLPAFAAALSLGADEIEFDVRLTKDAQLIISHDGTLDRISDGTGNLSDYTLDELKKLNIGVKHGWTLPFCTAEEVFEQFAGKLVFNIHLKECGENGYLVKELVKLADKYQVRDQVYFAGVETLLPDLKKYADGISLTAIQLPRDETGIYELATAFGCDRVQFWLGYFDETTIQKLHEAGIICNLFYADTFEDYEKYFAMGVDTLLTNRMDLAADYKRKYL